MNANKNNKVVKTDTATTIKDDEFFDLRHQMVDWRCQMSAENPTKEEIKSALGVLIAVSECIRELGSIPSWHLYAQLMEINNMDFSTFTTIITTLKSAGVIEEKNHLLIWVGGVK